MPDTEPEFDPATWTPDKPWPKGYYKPMSLLDRMDSVYWPGKGVMTSAEIAALLAKKRGSRDPRGDLRANLLVGLIVALLLLAMIAVALFGKPLLRWGLAWLAYQIN